MKNWNEKKTLQCFLILLLSVTSCQDVETLDWDNQGKNLNIEDVSYSDKMSEEFFSVDTSLAKNIGENITRLVNPLNRSSEIKEVKEIISYPLGKSIKPVMYIMNFKQDGFCIISADKRISPLLGYSSTGSFVSNDYPEAFEGWLNAILDVVTYFRENNLQPTSDMISLWNYSECPDEAKIYNCDTPENTTQVVKGPYLQSEWGQGSKGSFQNYDYNKYCPKDCPAGCSAVAIGQVMRFWEYPKSLKWSDMLLKQPSDATARFFAELGDSKHLNIDYAPNGSGAKNRVYDNVLKGYGYNASREKYNYATVKSNLYTGKPVLLSGKNTNGDAHVWVCDGVSITTTAMYSYSLLHMNWGWGGLYNGYYQCDNWSYTDENGNVITYEPNWLHQTIVNIYPK